MVILLAPDICRYVITQQPEALLQQLQVRSAASDELMLSSITYAELVAGALQTKNKEKHMGLVQAFCERLDDIVPWGRGAVDCYTQIQMRAMQNNSLLNMNDAMLAAHAIYLKAELLTSQERRFADIAGVNLTVWESA